MVLTLALASCERVNNTEVPSYTVRIDLGSYALWNTYGVAGVGDWRIFNRAKQLPSNFPYNANTFTGYGGVLLFMGLNSQSGSYEPIAFDAACPVENSPDISVGIDADNLEAVCPKCGSRYNVLNGAGGPIYGIALKSRYGLRTLKVRAGQYGGYIISSM